MRYKAWGLPSPCMIWALWPYGHSGPIPAGNGLPFVGRGGALSLFLGGRVLGFWRYPPRGGGGGGGRGLYVASCHSYMAFMEHPPPPFPVIVSQPPLPIIVSQPPLPIIVSQPPLSRHSIQAPPSYVSATRHHHLPCHSAGGGPVVGLLVLPCKLQPCCLIITTSPPHDHHITLPPLSPLTSSSVLIQGFFYLGTYSSSSSSSSSSLPSSSGHQVMALTDREGVALVPAPARGMLACMLACRASGKGVGSSDMKV